MTPEQLYTAIRVLCGTMFLLGACWLVAWLLIELRDAPVMDED